MKLLDKLRRVGQLAAIFSIITIGSLATFTSTAAAADNVSDGGQYIAGAPAHGIYSFSANFDNTNCDPNSLNNCSGLNGALCDYVVFKQKEYTSAGKVADGEQVYIWGDVYGDGSSNYTLFSSVIFHFVENSGGYRVMKAECDHLGGNLRRIHLEFANPTYATYQVNPYGITGW